MEQEKQIPIWFFIGAILAIYGLLILAAGIYYWFSPPASSVLVLPHLHADVWWGILLLLIGSFYVLKYNPRKN